jgi:hypothetical protein
MAGIRFKLFADQIMHFLLFKFFLDLLFFISSICYVNHIIYFDAFYSHVSIKVFFTEVISILFCHGLYIVSFAMFFFLNLQ